jgi:hypothetical protein
MFKSLHRFLIRNIDNIIYILFMIKTFLICSNLEKNHDKYFTHLYYYYIFSYIYGVVSYGLLHEILHCLILPRYPSYYNIKTIFTNLIIIFSYPSPNTNLF